MAAKQKGRLEKLLKSALSYLTKWKIAKDRIYSSLKLMKNLTEQRESVATALEDQEDFCKYFPDLPAKTAQKLQEEIERSLVVIEESRVAMSETAGIFENQSRKAHQVLNALVQTGPPEETLYLHSALSFSVMDQAEWIEDLAFICTKELTVKQDQLSCLNGPFTSKDIGIACDGWERELEGFESRLQDVEMFLTYTCGQLEIDQH